MVRVFTQRPDCVCQVSTKPLHAQSRSHTPHAPPAPPLDEDEDEDELELEEDEDELAPLDEDEFAPLDEPPLDDPPLEDPPLEDPPLEAPLEEPDEPPLPPSGTPSPKTSLGSLPAGALPSSPPLPDPTAQPFFFKDTATTESHHERMRVGTPEPPTIPPRS